MDPPRFQNVETAWQFDTQRELVRQLEALGNPEGGLLHNVRNRLAFAQSVEQRSLLDHRIEWEEAIASIADTNQCPFYHGLRIRPQLGLVPIGRDPDTGFWEFAHLQTGRAPQRGADGRIRPTEEMGLIFVLLPGGSYDMGATSPSPERPLGSPNVMPGETRAVLPVHRVTLRPFLLSKYEMTQGQWLRFTGENPSEHGPWSVIGKRRHTLLHPVESVNWVQCARVMSQLGLRLPSESEWEYAIRGGTTTVWYTGNDLVSMFGRFNVNDRSALEGREIPDSVEVSWDDGYAAHAPVGTYPPNPFGLHEMGANVSEWCQDNNAPNYEDTPRDGSPHSIEGSISHIMRGGSWTKTLGGANSAYRNSGRELSYYHDLGLRPAATVLIDGS